VRQIDRKSCDYSNVVAKLFQKVNIIIAAR